MKIRIFAFAVLALIAVACGKKDDNHGAATPTGAVSPNNGICQQNYYLSGGLCYPIGNSGAYRMGGTMSVVDPYNYERLLEGMGNGRCTLNCSIWNCPIGGSKCQTFNSTGYVLIEANAVSGGTVKVSIWGGSRSPMDYVYSSWGVFQPIYITTQATFYPTNNNQGFELVAAGVVNTPSFNQQLRIRGYAPDFSGTSINSEVVYGGIVIGNVTLVK